MIKKSLKAFLKNSKAVVTLATLGIYYYLKFVYLTSRVQFVFQEESSSSLQGSVAHSLLRGAIGDAAIRKKIEQFLNHQGVIFAFWHNRVALSPVMFGRCKNIYALISSHRDGRVLSRIVPKFNCSVISGSSNKNPLGSVKVIIQKLLENNNIIITPDGPRGPVYKINSAITNIARKYNKKLIPASAQCSSYFILNSWDKLIIPLPFCRITVFIGKPLILSADKQQNDLNLERELMKLDLLV